MMLKNIDPFLFLFVPVILGAALAIIQHFVFKKKPEINKNAELWSQMADELKKLR